MDILSDESLISGDRTPLSYDERVRWFFDNYYETGMEYNILLKSMENEDLDNFRWYGDIIHIPKYREDIESHGMNEAVFRSPKWLRNILDFEVATGSDIKGEPSKRAKEKEAKEAKRKAEEAEKEAEKQRLKNWNKRWEKMMEEPSEFREFYRSFRDKYLWSYDFDNVKKKWMGNDELWTSFDSWKKKKKDKEDEQERLTKELDNLFDKILEDFKYARYDDKVRTPTSSTGEVSVIYTFEDGSTVSMSGNTITYGNITYTVGMIFKAKFIKLFNVIIEAEKKARPGGSRKSSSSYTKKEKPKSDNPKRDLYDTLNTTIKQREDQLAKMSKSDPERQALEIELKAAKARRDAMKSKYKFEKLVSFGDYISEDISEDLTKLKNKLNPIKYVTKLRNKMDPTRYVNSARYKLPENWIKSNKYGITINIQPGVDIDAKSVNSVMKKIHELSQKYNLIYNSVDLYYKESEWSYDITHHIKFRLSDVKGSNEFGTEDGAIPSDIGDQIVSDFSKKFGNQENFFEEFSGRGYILFDVTL